MAGFACGRHVSENTKCGCVREKERVRWLQRGKDAKVGVCTRMPPNGGGKANESARNRHHLLSVGSTGKRRGRAVPPAVACRCVAANSRKRLVHNPQPGNKVRLQGVDLHKRRRAGAVFRQGARPGGGGRCRLATVLGVVAALCRLWGAVAPHAAGRRGQAALGALVQRRGGGGRAGASRQHVQDALRVAGGPGVVRCQRIRLRNACLQGKQPSLLAECPTFPFSPFFPASPGARSSPTPAPAPR